MAKDVRWGYFGRLFDLNHDGKLDFREQILDESLFLQMIEEEEAEDRRREAEAQAAFSLSETDQEEDDFDPRPDPWADYD